MRPQEFGLYFYMLHAFVTDTKNKQPPGLHFQLFIVDGKKRSNKYWIYAKSLVLGSYVQLSWH